MEHNELFKWQSDHYRRGRKKRLKQPVIDEIAEAQPAEADLRQAWGDFCYDLAQRYPGDHHFTTLTYGGEESPTISKAIRGANNFERWCFGMGVHGVGVIEKGSLHGRLHHHMLLTGFSPAVKTVLLKWEELYGFTTWSKARSIEATARYCAKYLVKNGSSDWRFF